MRHTEERGRETSGESRLLCAVTLACYLAALAALCGVGYSLTSLAAAAAGREVTTVYSRGSF